MALMRLGPFIFAIPTFSFEELSRKVSGRVESQMVIGSPPPTHRLGPGEETITLTSTLYPYHLNGGGLGQLEGVRGACQAQTAMMMVSQSGLVFGRWVIREVGDGQTFFHPRSGIPQRVEVNLALLRYNGGIGASRSGFSFF
jgi:phage protein U